MKATRLVLAACLLSSAVACEKESRPAQRPAAGAPQSARPADDGESEKSGTEQGDDDAIVPPPDKPGYAQPE